MLFLVEVKCNLEWNIIQKQYLILQSEHWVQGETLMLKYYWVK